MIIADGIFYFLIAFAAAYSEPNANGIISAVIALLIAVIAADLEKSRIFGRVMQVITSLLMSLSVLYIVEVLTTNERTASGALAALYNDNHILFITLLVLLTAGLTWLHFIFIKLYEDPLSFLFTRIFSKTRRGGRSGHCERFRGRSPEPTVDMLRSELDKYHASFTRLKLLIDEVTRSDAFRAGGDIAFDSISSAMDMVRKNNSEVESLYEKFFSADKAERENIMAYIYGVNRDMLTCEDRLRKAFEELKASYVSDGSKRTESSSSDESFHRHRRTYTSSSAPTSNEERVSMFFNGCETHEQLEKRYKSLAKTFHPDMESGDTETMALINREYDRLMEIIK